MDSQIRNFRDFLLLYNKLTEMCFRHCADNFYSRQLSAEETTCLDNCVIKFSGVNQRVMNAYVEDQTAINTRRMKEMEAQMEAAQAQAAQVQAARDAELAAATTVASASITAVDISEQSSPQTSSISA